MAGFLLKIETGGAAMPGNEEAGCEQAIAAALERAAAAVATGAMSGPIIDRNGNTVGRWDYTAGDVEPHETPILAPE